jgi:FixJ family two-component response regulator
LSSAGDALADNIDRGEVGVVDILQKPVNHADIVRLLKSQLSKTK